MIKKLISVSLTFLLVLTLTGCKDDPIICDAGYNLEGGECILDTTLYTTYTDETTIDFEYANKDFIDDGEGEVTLVSCTDGDTAVFSTGSKSFPVRFLGIDTPESTYRIDPWGKTASAYTCDKLTNATEIVLEADGERTDGNGRYLAWVWYDGRLLNLELIEQAFSNAKGTYDTKYEDVVYDAELRTQITQRRVWGEDDPNYDYSLEGTQVTIEELVTNPDLYSSSKIVITGIVSSSISGHPYIQQDGYGIYLYLGYEYTTQFAVGNEVRVQGLNLTYYPDKETGSPQLVGFYIRNVEKLSVDNIIEPRVATVSALTVIDLGSYLSISDLEVTDSFTSPNTGDYTITCEDSSGNVIGLHIQSTVPQTEIDDMFEVGDSINVIGPMSRYMGVYQFELSSLDLVTKN